MKQNKKIYTGDDKEKYEEKKNNIKTMFSLFLSKLSIGVLSKKRTISKRHSLQQRNAGKDNFPINIDDLRDLAVNRDGLFHTNFYNTFPDFDEKLFKINPLMKLSDIEFCALIKLKITTKQIATIKNISVKAVENKKYRLRKKLNIATNQDIYIWMQKL